MIPTSKKTYDISSIPKRDGDERIVALAGNPNVGKSTVFNELTGLRQHTGNWPGKTVTNAFGFCERNGKKYVLADLPGTYSLNPHSAEEEVARDFLISNNADSVVVVCDANCLERNLILVLQTASLAPHVVVCINLMDEAQKRGIEIDTNAISKALSLPVVTAEARNGKGVNEILDAVEASLKTENPRFGTESASPEKITQEAERIYNSAVKRSGDSYSHTERRLDKLLTSRITGIPIMLFMLTVIFWITIEGANYPSALLSKFLSSFEAPLYAFLSYMKFPDIVSRALTEGAYRVLAWVVSVMFPPMAIFFPLFTLLEDFGYLPRVAFNLDHIFKRCGACGKQSLTMCMGFGCNAAGVVGCRIIDSPRERLIAILTNSFVPCNGRFPSLIAIITIFFVGTSGGLFSSIFATAILTAVILLGILMTFVASKLLSVTFLRGAPSSFTLELAPYRRPQIVKTLIRSLFDRTLFVLGRAAAVAAPAGLVIWILANTSIGGITLLTHISTFLDPYAAYLGLDGVILAAFILGLPANEIVIPLIVMAYTLNGSLVDVNNLSTLSALFHSNGWNLLTAINVMLFSLMHWPCSTTLMTIKKETGSLAWTLLAAVLPTLFGISITAVLTLLWKLFF